MTIQQPVVLDVGPKEFDIGLTYTGSSRTTDFTKLALDPMPSFNRILRIFSMTRFKEKEAETKRREATVATEETTKEATTPTTPTEMEAEPAGDEEEDALISSQLSNISL